MSVVSIFWEGRFWVLSYLISLDRDGTGNEQEAVASGEEWILNAQYSKN